jgi:hypothetical protein
MDTREIPSDVLAGSDDDVAGWIWRNFVPPAGQADTVQGELLRVVEKLAWEAQTNGNINWDSAFESLLDYLERTVTPALPSTWRKSVTSDLERLRDFDRPYTDEDLYDRVRAAVVQFCRANPTLLPKDHDPRQYR